MGNDPNANPSYADSVLNLLQNIPNLILSLLNIRLIGYSYMGVIMLFINWLVAVGSCQAIMYDAPNAWGGKRNFCFATNKGTPYATGCCFPGDWFCGRGIYTPEGKKGGVRGRQPTPCLFQLIVFLTWFFNLLVMAVPIIFFVILVPMNVNNGATTDYPDWAQTKD